MILGWGVSKKKEPDSLRSFQAFPIFPSSSKLDPDKMGKAWYFVPGFFILSG
jgi:hypothetical protein